MSRSDDGLEVVGGERREHRPFTERVQRQRGTGDLGLARRLARGGDPSVGRRRVHGKGRKHQQHFALLRGGKREQALAATPAEGRGCSRGEKWNVGTEPRRDGEQRALAEGRRREGVERAKHRSEERRVGKECRSRWSPY